MYVQFEQVLASDRVWAGKVEDKGAGVEQGRGRGRLVRTVEPTKGRITRLGEGSGGTKSFIYLGM
jgi:hypothetical protein